MMNVKVKKEVSDMDAFAAVIVYLHVGHCCVDAECLWIVDAITLKAQSYLLKIHDRWTENQVHPW
jgi:hypothetical protein